MNCFEHVRFRPGTYNLHEDFFHDSFQFSILYLLGYYEFTDLKISTVPEQNKVVFEASERKFSHSTLDAACPLMIGIIGGVSRCADFFIECQDGSFWKHSVKDAIPDNENIFPVPTATMTRFECTLVLPDEHPVNENVAISMVNKYSKVFPNCHITYNGDDHFGKSMGKNKITWFLHHRSWDKNVAKIFEFNGKSDDCCWEISFSFDGVEKDTSFINGYEIGSGEAHIEEVKECIRQVLQKISGEKNIRLKNLNFAISLHIYNAGIFVTRPWPILTSMPPEFHLIIKDFKQQLRAYFMEHPLDLCKILKTI